MAKQKKSMIGLDPLAWLKDEAEDAEVIEGDKAVEKPATKKPKKEKNKKVVAEEVFKIKAIQDISTVAELHSELAELFLNEKVIFDGDEVERIDAASLQLLYSFIEQAREKNINVVWSSSSEVLRNNAKLLGMEEALQLNNAA